MIVDSPDGSVISHTFEQIMSAVNDGKIVYASAYGTIIMPLAYMADNGSFIKFSSVSHETNDTTWVNELIVNNDNSFSINRTELLSRYNDEINDPEGEKDIINVINRLIEKLGETVLFTEQTLTPQQQSQAKANLGIADSGVTTTEYEYIYNGDTNDENNEWVLNGSGHKMYVRLGDIPKGEINLVGSEVFVTNGTNASLSVHFTIEENHLTRELSMYDGSMVAVAVQPGFTQILQSVGYYTDYSTVLCICTRPGRYITSFGGWVEWITFDKTGIYGFETRTWGGNEYTSNFKFSATADADYEDGVFSPVDYKGNEIQAFTRGICIGDSVTEGTLDHSGGTGTFNRAGCSYPAILKRLTGLDITNAGIAGVTGPTWYATSLDSNNNWGDWVNNEWFWKEPTGTALDYSGYDFAIINLGINDIGYISETNTLDIILADYEVAINNIANKLRENNRGIKIFMSTIIPSYAPSYNENYKAMNNKIREITEASSDMYLLDLNTYSELTTHGAYNIWHPTAVGYVKLAEEVKALISYTINQNLDDFKDIQMIGTDYTL